jgi:endo-1,4-beta-xylanase
MSIARGIVGVAALGLAATGAARAGETTLQSAAAASGRYFGAALDPDDFDEKPYVKLATEQLGCVTPENQMKWANVEPRRGDFNWDGADKLVEFAKSRGQKIRGHNLVWHLQLPSWLTGGAFGPAELQKLMVDHIAVEAGRYKGAIYAWDVVNEPFTDDGAWRKSIWFGAMGADYVAIALRAARETDPAAKLYINDYNVETAGPKMRALYDLVASLRRAGAPMALGCNRISSPATRPRTSARSWKNSRRSASKSPSPSWTCVSRRRPMRNRSLLKRRITLVWSAPAGR